MKAFLKKYKTAILYWTILLFFLFYFAPKQSKFYLDQDIYQFKSEYLIPSLLWTFGFLALALFVFWLIKTRSVRKSTLVFLSSVLTFVLIIFFFQNIFLGIALYFNRMVKGETIAKVYQASFISGTEPSKRNFGAYDPETKNILIDAKLINELYHEGVKRNDTLILTMNKGLFGVLFSSHPFDKNY